MMVAFLFNVMSLHSIAYASASRMVDCLVEGTLVAAFAGLLLRTARRWNSGARFAVWFSALMAVAALPLLELMFGLMLGATFGSTGWTGGAGPSPVALTRAEITLPGLWAFWLFGAWATIAAFGLARVIVGLWHLRGLRRSCDQVDSALLDPELRETLRETLTRFSRSNGTRSPALR